MDRFKQVYTRQAAAYHQMIVSEDAAGNLRQAIERVTSLAGKRILDLGTGTGRLPLLLGDQPDYLVGLDLHAAMLRENQQQRGRAGGAWGIVQGDMRTLPFSSGWADVVTACWAIGHLRTWFAPTWQTTIGQILREMQRVAAPDGALIIVETLTTGSLTPAPPGAHLVEYYGWLENEWGFTRQTISTDYQFASVAEAVARTEFFFGPDLAAKIRQHGWSRLPEWTGVWARRR